MGVTKELQIFCLGGWIGLGIIHQYLEFCTIMFDVAIVEWAKTLDFWRCENIKGPSEIIAK